jgi:hypothetical protein
VFSFGHCLSPPELILQSAVIEGKHAIDRLAFHSSGCIKMCRDYF